MRWSARDLRRRWAQVASIALVIGIGSGVYSALGATAVWRRESNDASFEALAMYDLRVRANDGVYADEGAMLAALNSIEDAGMVVGAEERLVVPTQVDASVGGRPILVPGRIVGLPVDHGGPSITKVLVSSDRGRQFVPGDAASPVAVLERNFADYYDLASSGAIQVNGQELRYVGLGSAPEYLLIVTEDGGFFAQANFAAVFTSLQTAQRLAGKERQVNDLVIRLAPETDPRVAATEVERAFAGTGLGVVVMDREDEDAYRLLYEDIESDQKFWTVFAVLILAGASFAAFNLATRMVEAQRREIGVGMALGMSRGVLALRPMLVGAEIALLGVVFGIGVGLAADAAIAPVFERMLPMPIWQTGFQPMVFVKGAVLGFVLPLAATAWPVWRALRMQPVDAISTRRSVSGGLASRLRRLSRPRGAFARMPVANVLRTPRRTLLTALGIGASIAALVTTLGMIDSFLATIDRNDREVLREHPDRLVVALDGYVEPSGAQIARIQAVPSVGQVQPVLRFGGTLSTGSGDSFDVVVDALDFEKAVWTPTLTQGTDVTGGLVISREAASDLDLRPGDSVRFEHPASRDGGVALIESTATIAAVHPSPFRFSVYIDRAQLSSLDLPDVTNLLYVVPADGWSTTDVQHDLFGLAPVASVQPVSASSKVVKDSIEEFVAVFRVLEAFMLTLAVLIAYNATSINGEERRREHATLFAFGMPVRRVLRIDIVEAVLIGALGTALGLAGGLGVLDWVTSELLASTMPELGVDVSLSGRTIAVALVLGIAAVAAAPCLTARRLRAMNIPDTLRVVE